jgi:ABC-2 type transport system permease protein
MKMLTFSKRCRKEILRDPINLFFGLGFPIVLLLLLSAIQANIPADLFVIESLAPGIAVFGLSFMTLFSATLVARDRESSFLQRLYTTPLRSVDFILGYMLPLIPISVAQGFVCYFFAAVIGLSVSINTLLALLALIPISVFYISLGLLFGSILNVKQAGGVCGGLLTNLSGWLAGIWFDISLVGGAFEKIAKLLPFIHAVELERALINGEFSSVPLHLAVVLAYTAVITVGAVVLFLRQMKKQ